MHNLAQTIIIRFDLNHDVTSVTVRQQCGCLCVLEVPGSNLRPYVLRFPSFHPDVGVYHKVSKGGYIPVFLIAAIHKAENRLKLNMVFKTPLKNPLEFEISIVLGCEAVTASKFTTRFREVRWFVSRDVITNFTLQHYGSDSAGVWRFSSWSCFSTNFSLRKPQKTTEITRGTPTCPQ